MLNNSSLSWECFEECNPNKEDAFEAMCRSLFKKTFFNDNTMLHSNPNHPGVETEPIKQATTGKIIGFQAKYFKTKVGYPQIKDSAINTVKYYSGRLDIVYLYCNMDVTTTSKQYIEIEGILGAANITLIPVTNQEILNSVIGHTGLATYYFGKHGLTNEWFTKQVNGSLEDLGRRYNGRFNIDTQTEYYMDLFVGQNAAVTHINRKKAEAKQSLDKAVWRYSAYRSVVEKASKLISSLPDITKDNLLDCMEWASKMQMALAADLDVVSKRASDLNAEIKAGDFERSKYKNKRNEIDDLEWLCGIPNLIAINAQESILLNNKSLVLHGEAGTGKSQLFATIAKKSLETGYHAILLLGQSFLSNAPITEQITSRLGLNYNTNELFDVLEEIGDRDNQKVIILIDALNESENKNIWKVGIGQLIRKISEYNHLKIAVSIRSGYEELVLDEPTHKELESHGIANLVHLGFRDESVEAIQEFLNHYGVPFSPENYFKYEMTNPLYLTLLCETYDGNEADIFSLFERLIKKADKEAQRAVNLDGWTGCLVPHLVDEMAEQQLKLGKYSVSEQDIYNLKFWGTYGLEGYKIKFLSAIKRAGLFASFVNQAQEYCYISYNLLSDFTLANAIIRKYSSKSEVRKYLHDHLLGIKDGEITNYANRDVFIAVCGLFAEQFNEECIDIIDSLKNTYEKQNLINDYIHAYLWREKENIDIKFFLHYINDHHAQANTVFPVLIDSAVKLNHPLNAVFLHSILWDKSLAHRDSLWTTYINDIVDEGNRLSNLIVFLDKGGMIDESNEETLWLLLVLFAWLLTSSNRFLRDKTSKAMIEILKCKFGLSLKLLNYFEGVNDPYVIQRLYGIVFGACVKRSGLYRQEYADLAKYIIDTVFKTDFVYPDILMRDYARLIIERYVFEFPEENKNVDINVVRPPYRSNRIPVVSKQDYYDKDANNSGFNSISLSMHPNHPDCGPGMYGDFGRYVFQAAISKFEGVDISNLYHYAMQFIRDELGYDDRIFGQYDCFSRRSNYDRHEVKKIERIGKKYQWIALYNILARLSDVCLIKEWGKEGQSYNGPWEPYVRDFDPTINSNFLHYPEVPLFELNQDVHEEFLAPSLTEPGIIDWSKKESPFFTGHVGRLLLTDSKGIQWVSLFDSQESSNKENIWSSDIRGPASGSQIIWSISRAYFVAKSNFATFRDSLEGKDLWKVDLPESNNAYQLFNREYSWSPGIPEIFGDRWFGFEIETGEQVATYHEAVLPFFTDDSDLFGDELPLEPQGLNRVENVKANIGEIAPAFCRYLWEEEYDASQEDTTAFDIPCNELITGLKLEQKLYDGYYFTKEGILAAFDGSLQNAYHGLIIRKDLLDKFLDENDLSLLWFCTGEKQCFLGNNAQIWGEWRGLFYLDGDRVVGAMHPKES